MCDKNSEFLFFPISIDTWNESGFFFMTLYPEINTIVENVIKITETFDVTTIRATVGQYLVSKWISENTNIKVLLIGDGSDEVAGGYLYFNNAPTPEEFHLECVRRLHFIHYFDERSNSRSRNSIIIRY